MEPTNKYSKKNYTKRKALYETPMAFLEILNSKDGSQFIEYLISKLKDRSNLSTDERALVTLYENDDRYFIALIAYLCITQFQIKANDTKTNMIKTNRELHKIYNRFYSDDDNAIIPIPGADEKLYLEFDYIDRVVNIIKAEVFAKFKKDMEMYDVFGPDSPNAKKLKADYIDEWASNKYDKLKWNTLEEMIEFIEQDHEVPWVRGLLGIVNLIEH
ncbi:MAG: hypothetical protein GY710_13755 [Desulfobacteraceae bacterium]|nr:hypothetical protein [Desulfobacteraceae bacterium]